MRRHDDLAWFFGGDMEAALGLRSNFAPLVDLAMSGLAGGGARPPAEVSSRRIDDATRARAIRSALEQLDAPTLQVLWALHAPMQFAAEVRRALGELAAVVLLTPTGRRELERAAERRTRKEREKAPRDWLLSVVVQAEALLETLRGEADGLARGALDAYRQVVKATAAKTQETDAPPVSRRRRRRAEEDDIEPILPSAAWRR